MDMEKRQFFRDQLRSARVAALADAEGFEATVHSLELMGQHLLGKGRTLGEYRTTLSKLG